VLQCSCSYLQPGVFVVWPGGWHLLLPVPPPLPGPNDGSAYASGAATPRLSTAAVIATRILRFTALLLSRAARYSPLPSGIHLVAHEPQDIFWLVSKYLTGSAF
jgi:hypothetical protein